MTITRTHNTYAIRLNSEDHKINRKAMILAEIRDLEEEYFEDEPCVCMDNILELYTWLDETMRTPVGGYVSRYPETADPDNGRWIDADTWEEYERPAFYVSYPDTDVYGNDIPVISSGF